MVFAALARALRGPGLSYDDVCKACQTGSHAIVDVREAGEFASGHVPGAINMPLSRFDATRLPSDRPVILMCLSGGRSARALAACRGLGRNDILNYSGSYADWCRNGGQTERG
ncbi:MAG TPA: rhodanese-like domain-containing protein [Beijerinckiaceae bacterium]|nr:rhodanese-like domain-containing protein [Beijerinckiaceae bacterium]